MNNSFLFSVLLFFVSTISICFGQDEVPEDLIPTEPEACYAYIEEIMKSNTSSEVTEFMEAWKKKIKSNKWSIEHFQSLADVGNELIEHKMKRYNYFLSLLTIINVFSEDDGLSAQYMTKWVELMIEIIKDQPKGKTSNIDKILKFYSSFWKSGNLYDPSLGSHKWSASSTNFEMKYKDKELLIKYEDTDLLCYYKRDSLFIKEVKGIYYPMKLEFKGSKALVEWTAEGAEDAYAEIKNFKISTKSTSYSCNEATLYYASIFNVPIKGKLSDIATKRFSKDLRYPFFESDSRKLKMEDIGEGVNYVGGFSMYGAKVTGKGDERGLSVITVENNAGEKVLTAVAKKFDILRGERVISTESAATLYIYGEEGSLDSIFHPSIFFEYDILTRKVTLTKTKTLTAEVPFSNSMQDMDLSVSSLYWFIDTDELMLGDNTESMEMSSKNYFDKRLFNKYQSIIAINPIIKFAVYSTKLQESLDLNAFPEDDSYEEEELSDELYCEYYPELCDEFGNKIEVEEEPMDTAFLMEIGEWPPSEEVQEEEEISIVEYSPTIIDVDELSALLDERMTKITILNSLEIDKASKKPGFKVIRGDQDYRDFVKGYPRIYKFGIMDVHNLMNVVRRSNFDEKSALPLYMEMVKDGFLVYDADKKTIQLREKLFHYASSVNTKKKDYDFDRIQVRSVPSHNNTKPTNAVFNMKKGVIESFGVQEFVLSDSQNVIARPFEGKVDILANRDMDFDGTMTGGYCNFTGSGFHFKYDAYNVEMDTINFMDIFIYKRARYGKEDGILAGRPKKERERDDAGNLTTSLEPIKSVFEGGLGLLQIDVPGNKSGRMTSDSIYPSFEFTTNTFVYYDRNNRVGEDVYKRDSFYYELEPFHLDGLDDLDPEKLVFEGTLYSADIFDPIEEPLRVMYHDLSFGFETDTRGDAPTPIYLRKHKGGEGTFKGVVGVSNEGLLGNGTLEYLNTRVSSEYLEFQPDYMRAENIDSLNMKKIIINEVEFPAVFSKKVEVEWTPYADSMYIESTEADGEPFYFFDSTNYTLSKGSLTLKKSGLKGKGTFDWEGATMTSIPGGDFNFGKFSFTSKATSLKLKSYEDLDIAFNNDNVEAIVDFEKQTGDFIAKNLDLSTDLPYNNYETSLNEFHWDMKTDHIIMKAQDGKSGFFLATEESQDSLVFEGEIADFDLNIGVLAIDSVKFIRVADAFVYPKGERVYIENGSEMRTLTDSRIIADTLNKNHQLIKSTITIKNRNEYEASGYLEFNVENFKEQEILFSNVTVTPVKKKGNVTIGAGSVKESDDFFLDKKTRYKGDVALKADSKLLNFKGYAKIETKAVPESNWFETNSYVDKKNVAVNYDEPLDPYGKNMYVGVFLDLDTMLLYPTVLSTKRNPEDIRIFTAKGMVKYDNENDKYLFGDSARVMDVSDQGQLFTVAEENLKITSSGRFDFNDGFNNELLPPVNIDLVGDFNFFLNTETEYLFETSLNLDLYIPENLQEVMVNDFMGDAQLSDDILYSSIKNKKFTEHLENFVKDTISLEGTIERVKDDGELIFPDNFKTSMFFVNNKMLWSEKTQSFVTDGKRIQLGTIGKKHIGQVVKGHIEFMNDPTRGDALSYYITSPIGEWYYFQYQNGYLKTISSNSEYNNAISSLKIKDRKVKQENGSVYEIMIATPSDYSNFKNRASTAFN